MVQRAGQAVEAGRLGPIPGWVILNTWITVFLASPFLYLAVDEHKGKLYIPSMQHSPRKWLHGPWHSLTEDGLPQTTGDTQKGVKANMLQLRSFKEIANSYIHLPEPLCRRYIYRNHCTHVYCASALQRLISCLTLSIYLASTNHFPNTGFSAIRNSIRLLGVSDRSFLSTPTPSGV